MSAGQRPTIGRIVHYHSRGSADGVFKPEPRAAVVTGISSDVEIRQDGYGRPFAVETISLAVLNPTGFFFNEKVPFSVEPRAGHWSWPPRTSEPSWAERFNLATPEEQNRMVSFE